MDAEGCNHCYCINNQEYCSLKDCEENKNKLRAKYPECNNRVPGEWFKDADGCNKCVCVHGEMMCTKMKCVKTARYGKTTSNNFTLYATQRHAFYPRRGRQRCIMARNAAIQCTLTFHHLCYKSHVGGGAQFRSSCYYGTEKLSKKLSNTLPDPERNVRKTRKKTSNTLPDRGIKLETRCPAVALTITQPTRQSNFLAKFLAFTII
ncbi:hypothetical protein SFRURICE_015523 [Spodoptera frugiperda]|nr:hypothetical protein SFRURICE_015523 [Spodoptera frugiperda]